MHLHPGRVSKQSIKTTVLFTDKVGQSVANPALFVPEDENAVAHGDQTLDIEDFLKKTAAEGE